MCTSMALATKQNNYIFGRTMDFSYELDPEVYIVPREYNWNNNINNIMIQNKYKFIGTGQNTGEIIFVDGVNEMGLGVAALYFQGFAVFEELVSFDTKKIIIGTIDFTKYLLGNCYNIKDVIETVQKVELVGVKDKITNSVAPLHWIVIDKTGMCITIEKTDNGLEIFDNAVRVLANSPNFEWHVTNLRNYMNVTPEQKEIANWNDLVLEPLSQGYGTRELPGGYSSPSRFVRVAYQKNFVEVPELEEESVNQCFNIMKSVFIPKGIVITNRKTYDYTQYTVFMNLTTGDYYFNTNNNNQIIKVNINDIKSDMIISLGKLKRPTYFDYM